jgi:hypothetical protein
VDEKRKENGDTSKISYDVEVPDYKLVESALEKGGPQECTEQEKKAMHFYYHVAVRSVNGKAMGNKELLANKSLLKSMKRKDWYTMMACALTMMRYFSDTQNIVSRYRLVQQAQGDIAPNEDIKVKSEERKTVEESRFPRYVEILLGKVAVFQGSDNPTRGSEHEEKRRETEKPRA